MLKSSGVLLFRLFEVRSARAQPAACLLPLRSIRTCRTVTVQGPMRSPGRVCQWGSWVHIYRSANIDYLYMGGCKVVGRLPSRQRCARAFGKTTRAYFISRICFPPGLLCQITNRQSAWRQFSERFEVILPPLILSRGNPCNCVIS